MSDRVIAPTGIKQTGYVTSEERGGLLTMCACVNAFGNSIPPIFVFPRVHFRKFTLKDTPIGSIGATHKSGWMAKEMFVTFMEHFVRYSIFSKEKPVVSLMDNHDTHVSIAAVDLRREKGIIILTLPPHCSHKLQILDRTVFTQLKRYYNAACIICMLNHPGELITIYTVSSDCLAVKHPVLGAKDHRFDPSKKSKSFQRLNFSAHNIVGV